MKWVVRKLGLVDNPRFATKAYMEILVRADGTMDSRDLDDARIWPRYGCGKLLQRRFVNRQGDKARERGEQNASSHRCMED